MAVPSFHLKHKTKQHLVCSSKRYGHFTTSMSQNHCVNGKACLCTYIGKYTGVNRIYEEVLYLDLSI